MTDKKFMNVHEAPECLENLHVSSEDDLSDDEDFISRGRFVIFCGNIPIGSWDEEEAAGPSADVPSKRNEGLNFNGIL